MRGQHQKKKDRTNQGVTHHTPAKNKQKNQTNEIRENEGFVEEEFWVVRQMKNEL